MLSHRESLPMREISSALSQIPLLAGRALDGLRVDSLESLTNRNFRLTLGEEQFVLRIAGAGTASYIDRAAEAHNARLAAGIGIAPAVLHADPGSGLMLTRFVPSSTPLTAADLRQPETLRRALDLLKRLHESGLSFRGRMELLPKLDQYIALAASKGWSEGFDLTPARRAAEAARPALKRADAPWSPCHIDPVPHNFVSGGMPPALYLLDWEYAAMCEPMWDLAAVSIEAELDAATDRFLLDAYFGAAAAQRTGRFVLYKSLLNLMAAAWAVVQLADGNSSTDFAAFARARLSQHMILSETAAYRAGIEEAG
jgi:thiamine kinase-like enzyme